MVISKDLKPFQTESNAVTRYCFFSDFAKKYILRSVSFGDLKKKCFSHDFDFSFFQKSDDDVFCHSPMFGVVEFLKNHGGYSSTTNGFCSFLDSFVDHIKYNILENGRKNFYAYELDFARSYSDCSDYVLSRFRNVFFCRFKDCFFSDGKLHFCFEAPRYEHIVYDGAFDCGGKIVCKDVITDFRRF